MKEASPPSDVIYARFRACQYLSSLFLQIFINFIQLGFLHYLILYFINSKDEIWKLN